MDEHCPFLFIFRNPGSNEVTLLFFQFCITKKNISATIAIPAVTREPSVYRSPSIALKYSKLESLPLEKSRCRLREWGLLFSWRPPNQLIANKFSSKMYWCTYNRCVRNTGCNVVHYESLLVGQPFPAGPTSGKIGLVLIIREEVSKFTDRVEISFNETVAKNAYLIRKYG